MKIGIIGSGKLGSNFARILAKQGLSATIANRSGPQSLAKLVAELGPTISAGTIEQAASADLVLVAVPWVALESVLGGVTDWNNRIVIDGTNPVLFIDPDSSDAKDPGNPLAGWGIKAADLGGKYSSSVFRQLARGARVVKAFNHLDVNVLAEPEVAGGQRTMFYAGDDADAKAEVRKLLEAAGFYAVDLGTLDAGGPLIEFPSGALAMTNLIKL